MKVRSYSPDDFQIIGEWFKERGWPDLFTILPELGWVCEDDNGPIAAVWLYVGKPLGFLEWSVARPKSGMSGIKGLKRCIVQAQEYSLSIGLKSVLQFIPNERLVKYYETSCGFKATEKATLMVWPK